MAEQDDPRMDERRLFVQYMRRNAGPAPTARRLDIQDPLDDTGDTDCWTYAAGYAERTGADYVEGVCQLPPRNGVARTAAHAWCEEQTPFGRVLVEFTPGYEDATGYRGVVIDRDIPAYHRAQDGDRRYSVIELEIVANLGRVRT